MTTSSRRWKTVAAVGVAMFVVAGVGAYFGARGYRSGQAAQGCGVFLCIPQLKAATLATTLVGKGHTCETTDDYAECKLAIGPATFAMTMQIEGEFIASISANVHRFGSDPVSETGLAYLTWFATIPYAYDAVTSAEIKGWLTEQVNGQEDRKATIGDYEYTLTNPATDLVSLQIKGSYQ